MLIGAVIANIIAARHLPIYDKNYIVILGCGIRDDGTPTPLLKGMIAVYVTLTLISFHY